MDLQQIRLQKSHRGGRLSERLAELDMKVMSEDFRRMAFNASDADVIVQFPGIDYLCKL